MVTLALNNPQEGERGVGCVAVLLERRREPPGVRGPAAAAGDKELCAQAATEDAEAEDAEAQDEKTQEAEAQDQETQDPEAQDPEAKGKSAPALVRAERDAQVRIR